MLRKAFAGLLVILTALPFTAPFSVCELSHTSPANASAVDSGSHALPILAAAGRMRTRFISHVETNLSTHHIAAPASYIAPPASAPPQLPDRPSPTILRI